MSAGSQFNDREFVDLPLSGVSDPGASLVDGFRSDITTWAELAAILTLGATLNVILEWYDPAVSVMRTTVLMPSTEATDTSIGVQRPDDYDAADNAAVWFQIGGAG